MNVKIFTDIIEEEAKEQIYTLANEKALENSKIRIMPDVHLGKDCVIGFTAEVSLDKVIPSLIGVDIGCGVLMVNMGKNCNISKIDQIIKNSIPAGTEQRDIPVNPLPTSILSANNRLRCLNFLKDKKVINLQMGTLGGGNHFIEVDVDDKGNHYLLIHTGSRNLGYQVANFYQHAIKQGTTEDINKIIQVLKEVGLQKKIQEVLTTYREQEKNRNYLEGAFKKDYITDTLFCQTWAYLNRLTIAEIITKQLNVSTLHYTDTMHNYIQFLENGKAIIRKGAVAAGYRQKLVIPINMRDGALICEGKGCSDWNCSAPHGAGRIMSRKQARKEISMEEYKAAMTGIESSCVVEETLDEAPMAYRSIDQILPYIDSTVEVIEKIKPIYNFKATH